MARIISYPPFTTLDPVTNSDLLIVSDVSADNKKSLKIGELSTHIIVTNNIVRGNGTTNYVTQWTDGPNGFIGDSPAYTFDGGAGLKQFIYESRKKYVNILEVGFGTGLNFLLMYDFVKKRNI